MLALRTSIEYLCFRFLPTVEETLGLVQSCQSLVASEGAFPTAAFLVVFRKWLPG